ncbi:MAG: hypothetical protein KC423_28965, partial [Anaerolineales bacterium]|nr:hypothetical protein [Anaerolineales bacterium]
GRNLLITTPLLKLFDNQAIPASFCRLIRAKDLPTSIFLSTYLRIFYDAGGTWDFQLQSTGISNFQFSDFQERHTLTLPPQELIEEFMAIAMPNYQSIGENIVQSITLAKTRDTLLPKLMRGEIIV